MSKDGIDTFSNEQVTIFCEEGSRLSSYKMHATILRNALLDKENIEESLPPSF